MTVFQVLRSVWPPFEQDCGCRRCQEVLNENDPPGRRAGRNGRVDRYWSFRASSTIDSNCAPSPATNAAISALAVRDAAALPAAAWNAALSDFGRRNANVINGSVGFSFFDFAAFGGLVLAPFGVAAFFVFGALVSVVAVSVISIFVTQIRGGIFKTERLLDNASWRTSRC